LEECKDKKHSMEKHKHHIFGTVKVGDRGQIVIPKAAREMFDIESGDNLLVMKSKGPGMVIMKTDLMKQFAMKILEGIEHENKE
jgi:AbrB family looped-hinge helix DNA binding protein